MDADQNNKWYLKLGYAHEIHRPRDRRIYRALEMLPGVLAWGFLGGLIILSFFIPIWIAIFIIAFDVYWFLKVIYLSFLLRPAYRQMKKNLQVNWWERLIAAHPESYRDIWHLVILPMYNEPYEVVRTTFEGLVNSQYDKDRFIVVLALEERAGESAQEIGRRIRDEFGDSFGELLVTTHPKDIPGELPGKGSNETWAAKQVKREVIDPRGIDYKKIAVSVFDIDTVVTPGYFSLLTLKYLSHPRPWRASFQPVPLFTNNIWEAPALARVLSFSSTFWHMIQQERPEQQATFSSHSMSFHALVEVGFWQTNIVSEDSRIFWNCYLFYDGDYEAVSLYYPVSMDANVAPTFWRSMVNQYKQQRRWAWGTENLPYIFFGFLKNKHISFKDKLARGLRVLEGYHSWATNAIVIFLMGWLPVIVGGAAFNVTLLSYNLPRVTRTIITLAMVGIVVSMVLSINLLPPRPPDYGKHKYIVMVLQWIFLPPMLIIFGSVPALDAQTRLMLGRYMGFWVTPKARKGAREASDER